jgi:hypothetical protein
MGDLKLSDWLNASDVTPGQYATERIERRRAQQTKDKRQYRKKNVAYKDREHQQWNDKRANNRPLKPFVSIDGEGAPGRERRSYVRLTAGEHEIVESEPGKDLRWDECLNWLCNLPDDAEYVSFVFDYDVAMILCEYAEYDRGWPALIRLAKSGGGKPVLFYHGDVGWWVWYRPKMEFKVSPVRRCPKISTGWCSAHKSCGVCGRDADATRGHFIRISDTIKLFQSSLVKTIADWEAGTESEREKIRLGKDSREFVAYLDPAERAEVDEYNKLEVKLHAEIMEAFRDAWLDAGLPTPANWQSPGSLAKALLRRYDVPTRKELDALEVVPKEVWDISTLAYIAGWFEVPMFGPVPGRFGPVNIYDTQAHRYNMPRRDMLITEFDLTSAYPWAMTHLPCLRHSHWEHRNPTEAEYGLVCADARYGKPLPNDNDYDNTQHDDFPLFMGLPHRDAHGRVTRPLHTIGWYWNFEVAEARHQTIDISDGWTWVSDGCDCDMWSFVPELFGLRQQLGSRKGKPVKLGINSLYGVTAQRQIGESIPPFLNTVAASFITAWTRATIMRAIHQASCEHGLRCGSNVVMIATDAVFFLGDPGLPAWNLNEKSKAQLGDWTRETFPNGLFIAQGGIYWPIGEAARSKTRGVPSSILQEHIPDFYAAYKGLVSHDWMSPDHTHCVNSDHGIVELRNRRTPDGRLTAAQRFVGLREATHRNAKSELGRFVQSPRKLAIDWSTKRELWLMPKSECDPVWTLPKVVDDPISQPYEPVSYMSLYLPECMADEGNILDLMNDSPEWLPQVSAPMEDEGFNLGG